MKNIVVFASGSGSNALNLIRHFRQGERARVVAVFCNNPGAGVIAKARQEEVPVVLFNRSELNEAGRLDSELQHYRPDVIVLAGFLWLFPGRLISAYPDKIVNIHPALLPAYGGKGMYGNRVHEAVLANAEKKHGVTVHLVNEQYDKGAILRQESFDVPAGATLDDITARIHAIEYRIFPEAVEQLLG